MAMIDLPPTFNMLTFTDGTTPGALFRIDNSYEVSDTYSQFIPDWLGGEQRLQGRRISTSTRQIELPDQTDMNGRFAFRTDAPFNAGRSRRPIRSACSSACRRRATSCSR